MKYTVIFEKTATGYSAYPLDLPGCASTGRTLKETRKNIAEAIAFHLEGLERAGFPVPEPSSVASKIEVERVRYA